MKAKRSICIAAAVLVTVVGARLLAQEELIQDIPVSMSLEPRLLQPDEDQLLRQLSLGQTSVFSIRKELPGAIRNANVFEQFERSRRNCLAAVIQSSVCTPSTCPSANRRYIQQCFVRVPPADVGFIPFGVKTKGAERPITVDPTLLRESVAAVRSGSRAVCSGFFTKAGGRKYFVSAEHCFAQISSCTQPCLVRGDGRVMKLGEFVSRDIGLDISVWRVDNDDSAIAELDSEDIPSRSSTLVGLIVGEGGNRQSENMILASGPQTDCRILSTTQPWRCHQCQTLPKSSGSPLFSLIDGNWVVSGMHINDGSANTACRDETELLGERPQLALAGSTLKQFIDSL